MDSGRRVAGERARSDRGCQKGALRLGVGRGRILGWRADCKELFCMGPQAPPKIMAVDIEAKTGAIVAGLPHLLFETRLSTGGRNRWVATPDGKKFLAIVPVEQKPATTLNVILNWPSLLRK